MAENKKSFLLYADLLSVVEKLPIEKSGELFKMILEYVNDKNPSTEDLLIQIAFEPIKLQLKRDLKQWEVKKENKSNGGKLGNLKRWYPDLYMQVVNNEIDLDQAEIIAEHRRTSHSDNFHRRTSHSDNFHRRTSHSDDFIADNVTVNVNDNVTVNVNDNVTVNKNKEDFLKAKNYLLGLFDKKYVTDKNVNMLIKLKSLYDPRELDKAIIWATSDDFWKPNFLSPSKLTQKNKDGVKFIDVFIAKSKQAKKTTQSIPQTVADKNPYHVIQ